MKSASYIAKKIKLGFQLVAVTLPFTACAGGDTSHPTASLRARTANALEAIISDKRLRISPQDLRLGSSLTEQPYRLVTIESPVPDQLFQTGHRIPIKCADQTNYSDSTDHWLVTVAITKGSKIVSQGEVELPIACGTIVAELDDLSEWVDGSEYSLAASLATPSNRYEKIVNLKGELAALVDSTEDQVFYLRDSIPVQE